MNDQHIVFQSPEPTRLSRAAINELAEKVARKLGYIPGTSLRDIIIQLGGKIDYLDMAQWYADESGSIEVSGPGAFRVSLSQFTTTARDNFTLAHELGHYVLHSKSGKIPIKVSRSGSGRVEWEANWFAAAFLMPAAPFKAAVNAGFGDRKLASQFQTSVKAAMIRAAELGLEIA